MSSRGMKVLKEALSLPPDERAEIAEHLLSSLDPPSREDIDGETRRKIGWMHSIAVRSRPFQPNRSLIRWAKSCMNLLIHYR